MGAGDEQGGEETESSDSLLRELARAPARAPQPMPDRIGRFRILSRLGAGGMGVVYRAEDESLRRAVAIKVLPSDVQGDDERRKRLVREARAAAAVTHPNLAAVHEVGEANGRVYIATELVEGQSSRARLTGPLPVAESLEIATQIARGLSRAHAAGIVHRDLKPENVMLSDEGHVKILDFGLAKIRAADSTNESAFAKGETRFRTLNSEPLREGFDLGAGNMFVLAGRFDAAVPFLRRGLAACERYLYPTLHARAAIQLGEALEKANDIDGACEAYGKVIAWWPNSKPRSVSADKARARRATLHCLK